MQKRKIAEKIHWLGAVDWERRLFDSLIPLPDGESLSLGDKNLKFIHTPWGSKAFAWVPPVSQAPAGFYSWHWPSELV
jgi:flavorubredoxin